MESRSLKEYTTFRIGGQARYFVETVGSNQLIEALEFAKKHSLPFFILGGGSNLLVSDDGFPGLVIKIMDQEIVREGNSIKVDAGAPLSSLVSAALNEGLKGLAWAAGIPGTVGGAIRGNAGAFGSSMADVIKEVTLLNSETNQLSTISECSFGYRESLFKKNPSLIILSAKIELSQGDRDEILKEMTGHLNYRKERHPSLPSAGSIFKGVPIEDKLRWPDFEDYLPAAYIIDKCGLKGESVGGATVSHLHPNFIVNEGEAKAEDVVALIKTIKERVKEETGVILEEEIQYLGF